MRPLEWPNQLAWVQCRLLAGESVSHADLIAAAGGRSGWRLAANIHRLRREGWPIESRPLPVGEDDMYCRANPPVGYKLPAGWRPRDPAQLGLPL